jgi:putative nucleotidyltransferase with HDIG domain
MVGGAVRDMLRGAPAHDWDLATNALPEEVIAIFGESVPRGTVIPTGIKHGTVTVHYKNLCTEITTYRTESDYTDGRRPDSVSYAATIEEDLSRRDFTMNAIAMRLPRCEIIDPYRGKEDIDSGVIRCVGNAAERFSEDGLRPLRAVRFAAQLGYEVDQLTQEAIPRCLSISALVSAERVRDELDKIICSARPSRAFRLMETTGLLKLFLPELSACRGIDQKGYHSFDVLDHSLLACDYAAREQFPRDVTLAALLHDIGKPMVRRLPEGTATGAWTFYRHEVESARMTREILARLKYPNVVIADVSHLVEEHMFHYDDTWSDAAVRRFVIRVGSDNLENIYRLRRADAYATAGIETEPMLLLPLAERADRIIKAGSAFTLKDLAVGGRDLMEIGVKPGKAMGIILKQLLETVLDDPELNTREKLLEIAENIFQSRP